jgi:glycyl-tRNA synthetase beta chain
VTDDLLFEIGVEELPTSYILPALGQLERGLRDGLGELRLSFGDLCAYATPRRLAVFVKDLAPRQGDHEEEALGPAARVAWDAEGKPTAALLGFCKGKRVEPSQARRVQTPKGDYVAVTVRHEGRPAREVLPALLAGLPARLSFPRTMRWVDEVRFARPIRWLVALLGADVIPCEIAGVKSGNRSCGHRFLHPGSVEIPHAARYLEALEKSFVLADHRARALLLAERVEAVARELGGCAVADEALLEINGFLVEWPTALAGRFDPAYLELPREVIITALREHQRFFAVEDAAGRLLPAFIAVRNGDERGLDNVRRGCERVLNARLDDARFYWQTDLRKPPAERVAELAGIVWLEKLGTMLEKTQRLESLVGWLADRLAPGAREAAVRAAHLCKTDLLSEMIGSGKEYASLEGVMGGHYARRAGEPEEVCRAVAEHVLPRGAGDALPQSEAGSLLALADRLDHVAGAFTAGKAPSGSEDPYGVRRAANGVLRLLLEQGRSLDLQQASMQATGPLFVADAHAPHAEIMKRLAEFWRGRVESALAERGVPYDVLEAALEARVPGNGARRPRAGWVDPLDCLARAETLARFRGDERFEPLVILFKRVANILRAATETLPPELDRGALADRAERRLLASFEQARERTGPLWAQRDYPRILPELLGMEEAIHTFFDDVMVNVDHMPTRLNRLRLLADVRALFLRGWDLSHVVVEGVKG